MCYCNLSKPRVCALFFLFFISSDSVLHLLHSLSPLSSCRGLCCCRVSFGHCDIGDWSWFAASHTHFSTVVCVAMTASWVKKFGPIIGICMLLITLFNLYQTIYTLEAPPSKIHLSHHKKHIETQSIRSKGDSNGDTRAVLLQVT